MVQRPLLALCLGLVLTGAPVAAGPVGTTFAELAASGKQRYDAARKELSARGAKAKAAAASGDVATWTPLNEAYAAQLAEIIGLCERSVVALTSEATDLREVDTKSVVVSFTQYAETAGSMATVRLQMVALGHLVRHLRAGDGSALLKALAPRYFTGE